MKKKYIIVGIVSILILTVSVSLGYWMAQVEGSGAPITLQAQELKIVFEDTENINALNIEPGWNYTKTFTVENKSDDVYYYNIGIDKLVNTFVLDFLKYKIISDDGGYNMEEYELVSKSEVAKKEILEESIKIEKDKIHHYTIEFKYESSNEDQSADMGKIFNGNIIIEEGKKKEILAKDFIKEKYIDSNIIKRNNFSSKLEESKIYYEDGNYTEDLDKDGSGEKVYYWTGKATDNWVKFANLYWRIIRTNEDGGLRLLYAGTEPNTQQGYINTTVNNGIVQYNSSKNKPTYVGYMYGTDGNLSTNRANTKNSTIKESIDKWYTLTIEKTDDNSHNYSDYVSRTAIYCNDRSGDKYSSTGTMYYAVAQRITTWASSYGGVSSETSFRPSFKCGTTPTGILHNDAQEAERKKDMFTGTNSKGIGNQALTEYPVALMTADEIIYAGGKVGTQVSNAYYYLNSENQSVTGSNGWWTMSPSSFSIQLGAYVFIIGGSKNPGFSHEVYVDNTTSYVIRPVLSLKSCVTLIGNGTVDDPYIPEIDDTCAQADN